MKKYLSLFLLFFILFSCKETSDPPPSILISEDIMVKVMIDVQLLESAISMKNLPRDSSVLLYSLYEKDLFKKHSITDSAYKVSFNYYTSHPEIMNNLYERVVDSLSWREERKVIE